MSTLEEHVDVGVPVDEIWDVLHQAESYPRFVEGVRQARAEGEGRTRLDIEAGGRSQAFEAEVSDRKGEHLMEWRTTDAPDLAGSFSLQPIDKNSTRVQVRIEYEPGTIRDSFGGPKGFAQANAIERLVHSDLEHLKEYVEQRR
ncbi:SRPBCC family protein [Streptomyces sp. NPDC052309]|uniref:SRPBCC family protein n=1 Tax=Streptomyces griseicoloratus TaxID=2752516 RepID=A0A926LDJ8_9ACTN|nr:SRPBCC family protein [Streptomyces griseicoloratus]MBD0424617.1 SRPBCC family protein [Streptomyces griseicoloratus]